MNLLFLLPQKYTLFNTNGFSALKYYCIGRSVRLREAMKARYMTKAKIIYRKSVQIRVIRGFFPEQEAVVSFYRQVREIFSNLFQSFRQKASEMEVRDAFGVQTAD